MKRTVSLLLVLMLLFSLCGLSPIGAAELTDDTPITPITTGGELVEWLNSHLRTPGIAQLTDDVDLPSRFDFAYLGAGALIIETGTYTISTSGDTALSGLTVVGDGVDGPVLSGTAVSLSQCSVTATGRNGAGGTSVGVTGSLSLFSTQITAWGENAVGAVCASVWGSKGGITVLGDGSAGLRLCPPEDTSYYNPGELKLFTIRVEGTDVVSVTGDAAARKIVFTECDIVPAVDFGNSGGLEPEDNWNALVVLAGPEEDYHLPDFVTVNFKGSMGFATAALAWPQDLPDFSVPGTYVLTATVTSCELSSLVGAEYHLTVEIGENLPPVLNVPSPQYALKQLHQLQFPVSAAHGDAGSHTKLWYSADGGGTWNMGVDGAWRRFNLTVDSFVRKTPYLLVLQSEQDGVMNGFSLVWELTIHTDETYTLMPTQLLPPTLTPPAATAASWEALRAIAADENRTESNYTVTADLIVEDYVDLQSPLLPLSLDMGSHGIMVKDGGWLILGVDELQGLGTDTPLITVEPGGTLVLGRNTFYSYGIGAMKVIAKGSSHEGGVAVEVQAGGSFAAVNHPVLSAWGHGAVTVRSLSPQPFSLPSGLSLYAEGEGAAALETHGSADIFYSSVHASGDGAQAVRTHNGTAVVVESADVSPMPEDADLHTSTFLDFNQDVMQPQTLWLGKAQGVYLSDVPVLATVARGGNPDHTAAIWVDCTWDTSGVNFAAVGNYRATGRFSPLLPVSIEGLPTEKTVDVAIKDPTGKPDISIIYPLPPISVGGGAASYGFYIVPNADYTENISTLWCSTDEGDTWVDTEALFDVFWPSLSAGADFRLYVSGLTPDKDYLFKLESIGRSGAGDGPYAEPGVSEVRQVTVSASGTVVNVDWSGDRDGGDAKGNQPSGGNPVGGESGENSESTPTLKPDSTPEQTPSIPADSVPASSQKPAATPDKPVAAPAATHPPEAESSEAYSRLTGAQLRSMSVGGEVQFSKQDITIILSAKALEALSVADDSMFSIEIQRQSNNGFSFAVAVDDVAVSQLAGTRITLPYTPSAESPVITLKNQKQETVSTGSYKQDRQLAFFMVDSPGLFTIEEAIPAAAAQPSDLPVSTELPVNTGTPVETQSAAAPFLLFGTICLLALGSGTFLWKRRGKR